MLLKVSDDANLVCFKQCFDVQYSTTHIQLTYQMDVLITDHTSYLLHPKTYQTTVAQRIIIINIHVTYLKES